MNQQLMMDLKIADEHSSELVLSPFLHILQLNDDCLEKVFQYLSLADRISLARASERFQTIFVEFFASKYKSANSEITGGLSRPSMCRFIQLSSKHFQSLSLTECENHDFHRCLYSGLDFPNLTKLVVYDTSLEVDKLQRILNGTTKLKELLLRTQPRTDRLELKHLTKLKKLEISDWKTESLSLPTSVDTLTVYEWGRHTFLCLLNFLKNKTHIKKFQMLDSSFFSDALFGTHGFASLEVLHIRSCQSFHFANPISQFPKIKKLWFECSQVNQGFFSRIIRHRPHQLEHLEIVCETILCESIVGIERTDVLLISDLIGLHTLFLKTVEFFDNEVISKLGRLTELKRLGLYYVFMNNGLVLQLLTNCPKLSSLRLGHNGYFLLDLVHMIISLVRSEIQGGRNQRELPLKIQLTEYYRLKITSTDTDIVEVFFSDCPNGWFNEEFEV